MLLLLFKAMGLNGLEPSTSRLSGVRSNQLSYRPIITQAGDENRTRDYSLEGCRFTTKLHPHYLFSSWRGTESNCRHMELQSIALPTELPSQTTVPTGLEPVISCVTGRRPNQLDHGTILIAGAGFEPATFGL